MLLASVLGLSKCYRFIQDMESSRVSTSVSVPIIDMSRSAELLVWTSTHLYPLIAEAVAYGVYCVLFILCMVKLIRSGHTREWNGLRSLIFITAILMFCVGTTHFILVLQQGSSSIDVVQGSIRTRASRDWYEHTKSSLEVANCLMGDLVIISIAFTLEIHQGRIPSIITQRCMLYAIPAFFLAISCATGAGMVWTSPGADVMSNMLVNSSLRGFAVAWMSFILVTNLVYTAVFVYELLLRRKQHIEGNLSVYGGPFNAFLFTFIICGLLYCCTFLILLALYLTDRRIYWVANHMIPQLTGIYPITTIAVVAVKKNNAPSTLPYSFNRPRSRSDLIIRTPREIKCSLISSAPSNSHDTESARAALPMSATPSTLQIAYPPPTAFSFSRKLLSLQIPWRKGVVMRRSAVVPAIKLYIEVERTVEREPEVADALPKAICWSPMPHHLPWPTAGASSNARSRTLVDSSMLLERLDKYAPSEVEECDDTLAVRAKQASVPQYCPVAGVICCEGVCRDVPGRAVESDGSALAPPRRGNNLSLLV